MSYVRTERTHPSSILADPSNDTNYFTNARTITSPSYDGTGLIAVTAAIVASQRVKGNRVKITGGPYPGEYFIIQVVSTTRVVLNATFAVAAAAGTISFGPGVVTKQTALTNPTFTSNTITLSAGLFLTNRVNHRDLVIIDSASAAANNGVFEVDMALSETVIRVVGSPFSAGTGGNVQVQQRQGFLVVTNETAPTWSAVASAIGEPYILQRRIGTTGSGVDIRHFDLFGISYIIFHQTSAPATWVSESEIVVHVSRLPMLWHKGTSTQITTFRLGNTGGADSRDVRLGSCWVHMGTMQESASAEEPFSQQFYGSTLFGDATSGTAIGIQRSTGNVRMALFSNVAPVLGGIQDYAHTIHYHQSNFPLVVGSTPTGTMQNLNIGRSGATGQILFSAVTIRGHGHSAATTKPVYQAGLTQVTLLDPQEDYAVTDLITPFIANDAGYKDYTFNPRFVRFLPSTKGSSPVQNATMRLWQIRESDLLETFIGTFVSDANGRINAGAGVQVRRAENVHTGGAPVTRTYRHRLVVAANGFDPREFVLIVRDKVDQDFALSPSDFRGDEEFGI